jgi:DNA-binding transcriptional ArsR family regulator
VNATRAHHARADAVLGALGDPTRREVLQAVAERGPLTPTELAGPAGISRQAVSKHLGVLQQAGLVKATRVGREARYEVVPGSLDPAAASLDRVGTAWDTRLDRLRRHLADD